VRVRRRLECLTRGGFELERLAAIASRLRGLADAVASGAAALIDAAARVDEDIFVARAAWSGPLVVRRRALSVLIAAAAGADPEPPADAVAQLEARFLEVGYRGETLGGAVLEPIAGGVRLARDPGAVLGRGDGTRGAEALELKHGEEAVWDGRYALTAARGGLRVAAAPGGPRYFRCSGVELANLSVRSLLADHIAHRLAAPFLSPPFTRL